MHAVEFITDLKGDDVLRLPAEAAAQLPKVGKVRVIVLTDDLGDEDTEWRRAAYEQFLRDDSEDDSVYDSMR